jgi:uncharacterized protein YndB with AHSA1/START domain
MRVEREITVPAAPEEVYEVVMDPQRLADWVTIHEELKDAPSGLLEEGSRLHQRLKLAGRGFDVRWQVTAADRPSHVVWTGEGPARSTAYVEYKLSADDGGTRFGYVNEFNLPGGFLGRFAGRAVASTSIPDGEADRSLERLKALFEREG